MTSDTSETTSAASQVRARWAVELFERHISFMPHPNGGIIRLVQFAHDSPGLRAYKRQVSEALVHLVESNGGHVFNGLDDAVSALQSAGYTVISPNAPQAHTAPYEAP